MKEIIEKYRDKSKYDFSCSETILHAFNEKYQLNLDETSFKMVAAFSGGNLSESLCGIVSASLAVIGVLFTNQVAHNSPILKEVTNEFLHSFTATFGADNCSLLKKQWRDDIKGCSDLIVEGGVLLDLVIQKYLNKN